MRLPATERPNPRTRRLDRLPTRKVLELLNREQNLLIVLVTHEADIAAHARRVVFMRDGLILRDLPVQGGRHEAIETIHHVMASAEEAVAEARE